MGGLGNRMIQYLAALALAGRVPGARLVQIHLPEWGLQIPPVPVGPQERVLVETADRLDLDRLAGDLNEGRVDRVDIRSYAQHIDNLAARVACLGLFAGPTVQGADAGEVLINLRGGDILDGHHPDYVLVPIDFYEELVGRTGLAPVFMGQLDDSPYLRDLRARFPDARYLPSQGAVADFAFIRASHAIVPAISTFSWLAAWLSDAEVFLPVLGLLHPLQSRSTNLLPLDDERFRFFLFPYHHAVPVDRVADAHASLRGLWRGMPAARLRALLSAARRKRDKDAYLQAFDETFYLTRYPDIGAVVSVGHMPSGRHHYEHFGFDEGRDPFAMDRAWYCRAYPIAAVELGQGDAVDAMDHFLVFGRDRGYRPTQSKETA